MTGVQTCALPICQFEKVRLSGGDITGEMDREIDTFYGQEKEKRFPVNENR